ncbi:hypothetical protein CPB84DRAFT_1748720 [Gymnopilus junonius]|uniref:DUF6533 domain-containing protein n=1 Tax=Gymnopilus junonius TaxID=109634 RepID=A0A9P5NM98_GYMJU|nr:hypothetical protein CPB84DRAFT_1748720 [Gymnopilus junonius]
MESEQYPLDASSVLSQAAVFVSSAATAAQAWDTIVSVSDEVEYLWRGKFRLVKGLYIASRYGLLVVQLVNQLLNFQSKARPLDASLCARILVFKSVVAQSALTLVEIILLIRVYALYNQSFKARTLLTSVFVVSTILEISGMSMIVRSLAKVSGCNTPKVDKQAVMLSGTGAGLCQFVVFTTTVANLLPSNRRRTPLTSLMLKEGIASFILLLGEDTTTALDFIY